MEPVNASPIRRICIASNNIGGLARNGVATANSALAKLLAAHGHDVVLIYSGILPENPAEVTKQQSIYRSLNIDLRILPQRACSRLHHLNRAYDLYQYLLKNDQVSPFDIIHFSECQGHGYYALKAKKEGAAFANTTLAVTPHGSLRWCHEGNHRIMQSLEEFSTDAIEQKCVELADVLLSPSQHMLDWIQAQGWGMPDTYLVRQYVLPIPRRQSTSSGKPLAEIVFFGRLELRKGIHHFITAVDRIQKLLPAGVSVTFLGEPTTIGDTPSSDYISRHCRNWKVSWKVLDQFSHEQAMDYIQGDGRLSVIASAHDNLPNTILECLALEVPFICSNAGGIPEMIDARDSGNCIFDLSQDAAGNLAGSLLKAFQRKALQIPRFRVAPEKTDQDWLGWHRDCPARSQSPAVERPPVEQVPPKMTMLVKYSDKRECERFEVMLPKSLRALAFKIHFIKDQDSHSEAVRNTEWLESSLPTTDMLAALSVEGSDMALFIDAGTELPDALTESLTRWFYKKSSKIATFPLRIAPHINELFLPSDTSVHAAGFGMGVGTCFAISSDLFPKAIKLLEEHQGHSLLSLWAFIGNQLYLSSEDSQLTIFTECPLSTPRLEEHWSIIDGTLKSPHIQLWANLIDPSIQFILRRTITHVDLQEVIDKLGARTERLSMEVERKNKRIERLLEKIASKPSLPMRIIKGIRKHWLQNGSHGSKIKTEPLLKELLDDEFVAELARQTGGDVAQLKEALEALVKRQSSGTGTQN